MVEEGVDRHYVSFLQSDDEMIYFNKSNFDTKIKEAMKKIDNTYKKRCPKLQLTQTKRLTSKCYALLLQKRKMVRLEEK
jgi:hypothetical protein